MQILLRIYDIRINIFNCTYIEQMIYVFTALVQK